MVAGKLDGSLSFEEVRRLLDYDQHTGVLRWRVRANTRRAAGDVAGCRTPRGYVRIQIRHHMYLAHRLAWVWMTGTWPADEIDHRDGDPSNNAWSNLRAATRLQNGRNRRMNSNNSLGIKGVRKRADYKRYEASITADGRKHVIGYFDTPEEARQAYRLEAGRRFGLFARD
jgi:hypothetical protein